MECWQCMPSSVLVTLRDSVFFERLGVLGWQLERSELKRLQLRWKQKNPRTVSPYRQEYLETWNIYQQTVAGASHDPKHGLRVGVSQLNSSMSFLLQLSSR